MEFKITITEGKICFYSTHDLIQGYVRLEFKRDTVIDELSITLQGKASIRVEKHVLLSNRADYILRDHTFLRMSHPVQPTDLPENRLARRWQSHIIPFDLTVPDALLPYSCSHAIADESVMRKAHLLLPPSIGISRTNGIFVDNLGPKKAKVAYSIHVRVRKYFPNGGFMVLQKARPVCVIPTRDEEPPISIEENDPCYTLSKEKDVFQRFSAFGKPVGRLVVNIAELNSLKLPRSCDDLGESPTWTASVDLRFQPTSQGEPPPRLDSITIRLQSFTFLGTSPYETIPRPGDSHEDRVENTRYMDTTRLGNCILKGVVWARQGSTAIARYLTPRSHFVLGIPLQIRLGSGPATSLRALAPQNHVLCD